MKIIQNIAQLATCRAEGGQGEIHPIPDAALVWEGDTIVWVGPRSEVPARYGSAEPLVAGGGVVIPGLVDCHTRLAFGGWRAEEFVERIEGRSYLEIARAGGGIARTVRLTRAASEDALLERAEAGETILVVPPGLDASGYLLVHEGPPDSMRRRAFTGG